MSRPKVAKWTRQARFCAPQAPNGHRLCCLDCIPPVPSHPHPSCFGSRGAAVHQRPKAVLPLHRTLLPVRVGMAAAEHAPVKMSIAKERSRCRRGFAHLPAPVHRHQQQIDEQAFEGCQRTRGAIRSESRALRAGVQSVPVPGDQGKLFKKSEDWRLAASARALSAAGVADWLRLGKPQRGK